MIMWHLVIGPLLLASEVYCVHITAANSETVSSTSSAAVSISTVASYCCAYTCACGVMVDPMNCCCGICYDTYDYTYALTGDAGHQVIVAVEYTTGGCDDFIAGYDGTSTGATQLFNTALCASTGVYVATGNQMFIQFTSNGDGDSAQGRFRHFGFNPEGNPAASQTIFASPQTPIVATFYPDTFPNTYTASTNKYWILKAPCQSYLLKGNLWFSDLHNCNDQLILRDGRYSTSTVLRTYCTRHSSTPDTALFTSSQQYIYVDFQASSGTAYYGWFITYYWEANPAFTYTTPISTCSSSGTSITAYCPFTDLELRSPNYGSGVYNGNEQCEYIIGGDDSGYRVKLEFQNFDVENETYCVYDSLAIYDGNTVTEANRLNTFCGVDTPPVILSSGEFLRLVWKTDYTLQFLGFNLLYSSINSTFPACHSAFTQLTATSTAQVLTTANWPNDYTSDLDEYWWINNPNHGGNNLVIEITEIDVEKAPDCKYDRFIIYSGPCTTYPVVATYCDKYPKRWEFTASADYLVRFHTDHNIVHKGISFKYLYETVNTAAAATIRTTTKGPDVSRIVEMMQELVTNETQSEYFSDTLPMKDVTVASPGTIDFYLVRLFNVDELQQKFKVSAYFRVQWLDEFLVWEPDKKDGVQSLYVAQGDVWKPDLVHANSVGNVTEMGDSFMYVVVSANGTVTWSPQEMLESSCDIDMAHYPSDQQTCSVKVRSWVTTNTNLNLEQGADKFQLDSRWTEHAQWKLVSYSSTATVATDTATGSLFNTFTYTITVRRRATYTVFNILVTLGITSLLNTFTFVLPFKCREKARFSVVMFVAHLVHIVLVYKKTPENSEKMSLFALYALSMTGYSMLIVLATFLLMRVALRNPSKRKVGPKMHTFTRTIQAIKRKLCFDCKPPEDRTVVTGFVDQVTWMEAASAMESMVFCLFLVILMTVTLILLLQIFLNSTITIIDY